MNWSFVFLAQHERPGRQLSRAAAYHRQIDRENECEKIRNAETGKPRKENTITALFLLLGETYSRFKPGETKGGNILMF